MYLSDISKLMKLIPTREFIEEINNLLFVNFNARLDGTFIIEDNHLNIHQNLSGKIFDYSLIEEFKSTLGVNVENVKGVLNKFDNIKEKCKKINNYNCSICENTSDVCMYV